MASIRIAYLVSRYPAISHSFILREVRELRRLGFDIHVASINQPDRPRIGLTAAECEEEAASFYVKKSAPKRFLRDLLKTLTHAPAALATTLLYALRVSGFDVRKAVLNLCYLAEAVILACWMKRLGLNHLHVHFATPAATVALFVSKLAAIDFSLTVHGPEEFFNVNEYLLRRKCSDSRFLCAISHYTASQLMRMMPVEQWTKLKLTPLGVDPAQFLPARGERAEIGAKILCVGRLVPEKGQHALLEAMAHLLQQGRSLQLVLVGDGPERASLQAFAKRQRIDSSVRFTGSINQDQIRSLYGQADLFVLASFAEGVPVVLMEAMSMEIPCISTWVAGIPELIRDGMDGLLVPPGSPIALEGAIARLLDDDKLRVSLGKSGRCRVIDKYNLTKNVHLLSQVFEEQLGQAA